MYNLGKSAKSSVVSIIIICIIIINFNIVKLTVYLFEFQYLIIDILLMPLIIFVCYKSIDRIVVIENMKRKIYNLEKYNETLLIMYDSIRGFRHDYANFIQALNGYAQMNDIEGIKKLSKSATNDCISINNMEILNPKVVNNPAVYSIILNKYFKALEKDIKICMEVMIDINSIQMPIYELCRILGILLDNAIEAAQKTEEKIINIKFISDTSLKRKLVIIENSYIDYTIDIDKIFEKGFSTKMNSKNEHGLGLWTVRKILRKLENVNLYTKKSNLFCQQIEVYEIEKK